MISPIWRGVVRRAEGDAYADDVRDTGFNGYAETDGPSAPAGAACGHRPGMRA